MANHRHIQLSDGRGRTLEYCTRLEYHSSGIFIQESQYSPLGDFPKFKTLGTQVFGFHYSLLILVLVLTLAPTDLECTRLLTIQPQPIILPRCCYCANSILSEWAVAVFTKIKLANTREGNSNPDIFLCINYSDWLFTDITIMT